MIYKRNLILMQKTELTFVGSHRATIYSSRIFTIFIIFSGIIEHLSLFITTYLFVISTVFATTTFKTQAKMQSTLSLLICEYASVPRIESKSSAPKTDFKYNRCL